MPPRASHVPASPAEWQSLPVASRVEVSESRGAWPGLEHRKQPFPSDIDAGRAIAHDSLSSSSGLGRQREPRPCACLVSPHPHPAPPRRILGLKKRKDDGVSASLETQLPLH